MKRYYWKSMLDDFISKWKIIAVFVVLVTGIASVLGYKNSNAVNALSEEQKKTVEAFQAQIATYDTQIEEMQKSISQAEQEKAVIQDYVDNALYMKLDAQNVQAVNVQYAVTDTMNTGNVLSGFVTWLGNGPLQEVLEQKYEPKEAGYIKEMMYWGTNGNLLDVTIYHVEMAKAEEVAGLVKDAMEAYEPTMEKVQGKFTLKEVKTTSFTKVDMNVANNQNAKRDSLKNYTTTLADYHGRLNSYRTSKANYEKENTPEVMEAAAPGKKLIMVYAIFGVMLGVVMSFAWFTFRYILSNRIHSAKELLRAKMPVFGSIAQNAGIESPEVSTMLEQCAMELKFLAAKKNTKNLCIRTMCGQEESDDIVTKLTGLLEKEQLTTVQSDSEKEDTQALRQMIEVKHCLLVVKVGKNTYPQLQKQLELCNKYQVEVWGCVVIE